MDKENLERCHSNFGFITFVLILAGLASAVRYFQVDGKGMYSQSRVLKVEEEIGSYRGDSREYRASLIELKEEVERLKQSASLCDSERRLCCLLNEYEERLDGMADQVDRFQSRGDKLDKLAHAPAGIQREPSFDVLETATPHTVEMGRAKLVYIEKSNNPSEEIHTATRLHFQKTIHKAKVLNLRREAGQTQGSVSPIDEDGGKVDFAEPRRVPRRV